MHSVYVRGREVYIHVFTGKMAERLSIWYVRGVEH
jgi:hypothetical protein